MININPLVVVPFTSDEIPNDQVYMSGNQCLLNKLDWRKQMPAGDTKCAITYNYRETNKRPQDDKGVALFEMDLILSARRRRHCTGVQFISCTCTCFLGNARNDGWGMFYILQDINLCD